MSSAEVDELRPGDGPTKRKRRRALAPALAVTTAELVACLIPLCFGVLFYYHASQSTHVPTSLVYPRIAEAAVERAAAIGAVVNTSEYSYTGSKILGNGAFGYVFTAVPRSSPRDVVAIKSLRNDTKSNRTYAAGAAQVLGEARLLAAAGGHPSVVAFRAIAVHPKTGDLYLVMEHAGRSLAEELYINRGGAPFPEGDVRRVMRRLLAGVEHMHSRGVVHRDVKPANVLVSDDEDSVKIGDLGVAMEPGEPEPHGRFGTSEYMAPEILAGRTDYGAKVDTWSLGCVMAELLSGKQLFYVANAAKDDDAAQLRMIFDVVGPPCPGYNISDKVPTPPNTSDHRHRLRDMFPEHALSEEGFDVLKGLLSCDVDSRLSATDALQLPWFADDPGEEGPWATDAPQLSWLFAAGSSEEPPSATSAS